MILMWAYAINSIFRILMFVKQALKLPDVILLSQMPASIQ